jgi:PKHD-type hydroxylase
MNRPGQQQPTFRPFRRALMQRRNDQVAHVCHIPNFLAPQECERIVNSVLRHPPSDGEVGGKEQAVNRGIRESNVWVVFPDQTSDWLFSRLEMAVEKLNERYQFDLLGFYEGAQVARYRLGGHYGWHMDLGEGIYSARKLFLSVQLTPEQDYDGGELEFQFLEQPEPRTQGSLIAFPSFLSHRVSPVTRGERFSLVVWITGQPFR